MQQPKPNRTVWILSIIGFAIAMSILRVRQQEQWKQEQVKRSAHRAAYEIVVWVPGPSGGMIPHFDVEVLEKETALVKFRVKGGQIIEQHGPYRIETRKRGH